jgi:hypothetical protein
MVKVIVVLVRAVRVAVLSAVEDTDAEGLDEANEDIDADVEGDIILDMDGPADTLGVLEIVKVIVMLVRAVTVAVLSEVEDTDAEGLSDANEDIDADVEGDITLDSVALEDALGVLEIVKVIVVLVRAVRVAVLRAVEDTDAEGLNDANEDIDADVEGDITLDRVAAGDALGVLEIVKVIVMLVIAVSVAVLSAVEDTDADGVNEANEDIDADVEGDIMLDKVAVMDALGEPEIV